MSDIFGFAIEWLAIQEEERKARKVVAEIVERRIRTETKIAECFSPAQSEIFVRCDKDTVLQMRRVGASNRAAVRRITIEETGGGDDAE